MIGRIVKTLVIGVMVLVGGWVLLFGGRRDEVAVGQSVVVVDYWEKWTGDEGSQMREIVDEFNATVGKEKGIFVRYVSTSQIMQKTLIATAAGVPPDIAGVWDTSLAQLANLDALEPLDEMAAERGIGPQTYKKVYWDACVHDGKLMAVVSTPATIALHYNKRLFAERAEALRAAGLDPSRPPETLEELDQYAAALTIKGGDGRLVSAGYLPLEPGWYVTNTPNWFGADIYDPKTDRFTFDHPAVLEAYEWIASYSKKLGKAAMADFRSGLGNFDSPQNAFLAGTVVMVQQGPWMANYIRNLKPSMSTVKWPFEEEMKRPLEERFANYEWAVAPFPAAKAGLKDVTYAPFDALVIPRGAKHPKEAFEFLAYVTRQDVHEKLNMLHCKNSALEEVSEEFMTRHPNPYIEVFERLARSENAYPLPPVPIWPEVVSEMGNLVQRVALLEVEPKEGLAKMQATLQAKLDQFRQRQATRRGDSASMEGTR